MRAVLDTSVLIADTAPPAEVARAWGPLAAAVAQRGGAPRRRRLDLAIAATATVEKVPLLTLNVADFRIIDDLVDVRLPR